MPSNHALAISNQSDVIRARMCVRDTARSLGMEMGDQARISLATSALANGIGLGAGAITGRIDIACLEKGQSRGLRVTCTFPNNRDGEWLAELARSVRWMLDSVDIQQLVDGCTEIAITKWIT